jgi:hypothetical protein
MVLQSTNSYGGRRSNFDQNSCFKVQVADLKEMIVHTQSNVVGFTFIFKNETIQSYRESSYTKVFYINLRTSDLIGSKIYVGGGIEGLQFQLYDWSSNKESFSEIMGQSSGCFSYFNSNFMNINYLKIDSIQGCFDAKESNYCPFLSFSYSFSQCSFVNLSTTLKTTTTGPTETTTIISTSLTRSPTTLPSSSLSSTTIVRSNSFNK